MTVSEVKNTRGIYKREQNSEQYEFPTTVLDGKRYAIKAF